MSKDSKQVECELVTTWQLLKSREHGRYVLLLGLKNLRVDPNRIAPSLSRRRAKLLTVEPSRVVLKNGADAANDGSESGDVVIKRGPKKMLLAGSHARDFSAAEEVLVAEMPAEEAMPDGDDSALAGATQLYEARSVVY